MKRVLITGSGSYIGNNLRKYLSQWPGDYLVNELDMLGDTWKQADFSSYDSIVHVAGIAHQDSGKLSKEREALYFAVNTDLCAAVAQKAKDSGVKQFIFMSSMSVYSHEGCVKRPVHINRSTIPAPKGAYGRSKLAAEKIIESMQNSDFYVCILRPPMIYGKECKGNYPILVKLATKLPIFPGFRNERSILYIINLCEFVKHMVDDRTHGVFFPQNAEYVSTALIVTAVADFHGKRLRITSLFDSALSMLSGKVNLIDKAFGSLVYEKDISIYRKPYQVINFLDSIKETEESRSGGI